MRVGLLLNAPSISKYSLVLDAMQKAVDGEVEEVVRKASNKDKRDSSAFGHPSRGAESFRRFAKKEDEFTF